jgi:hypothetical protein
MLEGPAGIRCRMLVDFLDTVFGGPSRDSSHSVKKADLHAAADDLRSLGHAFNGNPGCLRSARFENRKKLVQANLCQLSPPDPFLREAGAEANSE